MKNYLYALGILFSLNALADQASEDENLSELSGYYLAIDESAPGADALLSGNYENAITLASRAIRLGDNLSAHLTLCVAYIRIAALEDAIPACDDAVDAAQVTITTVRNPHGRRNREGLAKAYMNRGVLMSKLGDLNAARDDFRVAMRQRRQVEMVQHNMALNTIGLAALKE